MSDRMPVSQIASMLAERVDDLAPVLLPCSQRVGSYWIAGDVTGGKGKSFYLRRTGDRRGKWTDEATGDHGDMLELVFQKLGGTKHGAIEWAKGWLKLASDRPMSAEDDRSDADAILKAVKIWNRARAPQSTLAEKYLASRKITLALPPTIRFLPSEYHHPSGRRFPAMVAALSGESKKLQAVHRVFIDRAGLAKAPVEMPKITNGRMKGTACRLAAAAETLGLAEGIETGLSAMQMFGVPVWAACGSRLDGISVPQTVTNLIIFADKGEPGERAAEKAKAAHSQEGRTIQISYPTKGKDFNDQLRGIDA